MPPPPDSPADYAHASQSFAFYDYVRALVAEGRLSIGDVAARSEGLAVRDDTGSRVLRDVAELTPDELTAIELLARQNGGSGYIENYDMGDEYDNSVAENVDDADEHRRGGG